MLHLSDRVEAIVNSAVDRALKRQSELLKSVDTSLKQTAETLHSGNDNATVATAPARDEAAPSVSQPEDILPKRANDSEPLPLNSVADSKDNNNDEISRDNADTSTDELDFQPLESRPHSHNVTPYEQQVSPVASNTRVKARGTVEAVTMGTRPRPRVVADRGAISRSGLKVALGASRVHMFVSRLDSGTTSDQLKEHLSNHNIDVFCIEALETKHHSYASFKITIPSNKFMIFRYDQVWPEGIYVRKFYGTRNAASTYLWWRTATTSP